ncbi:MAG: hydroxyacid dehydrogenase [Bacillota bacterium]
MTTKTDEKQYIAICLRKKLYHLFFDHIAEDLNRSFELIWLDRDKVENSQELNVDQNLLNKVTGYIIGWGSPRISSRLLSQMPNLEIIALGKGSVKGYVNQEVFNKGIKVTSCHMAIAPSVAETTLMLTLMGLKLYSRQRNRMEEGKGRTSNPVGYELIDKTVGLLGYGRIARCFRKLLTSFDAEVLAFDPYLDKDDVDGEDIELVSLPELIKRSDIISLHAPGTKANENLIDREAISNLKDDALIVNTARGILIDEEALIEELQTGRIRAALDVFKNGKPQAGDPLWELDNVVVTPHIGGYTIDSRKRVGDILISELKRHFKGEKLKYRSNPDTLSIRA